MVEGLFFGKVEAFDEVGNRSEAGVAVAAHPAVFTFEIGTELTVRAEAGENRLVVGWEVVAAKLVHIALGKKRYLKNGKRKAPSNRGAFQWVRLTGF
jgi:hypothetical protein